MRPKRDPVPRARDAWIWLGGLAMLGVVGALVTGAAVVLWENIDIRQLVPQLAAAAPGRLPTPEPPRAAARDGGSFRAVFFAHPRNRAFFPDSSYHAAALDEWRDVVRRLGGSVREATSVAELRETSPADVMVLVEAPCLSAGERAVVRAHLRAGGGVVANWAVGARDEACEWRGWQTVAELTGAEDVRELPTRDGLFLTVPGGVPLARGLDPGTRIELRPDPSLALRLPGERVYWSDWALNAAPDEGGGGADAAAIAWRIPEGGRTAWFGMRLGQAVTELDAARLRRMVENGILWAAGIASAASAPWPDGHRAALVFVLDVEDQPRAALDVANLLREENVPGTFFAVSQIVGEDAELAAALAEAGEVGSQTSDHTPVIGLTEQDQRVRLRRSWTDVEEWTGVAPMGLHPPEESFDSATLAGWRVAGGTYLLANNEARSASPEIHRTEEGDVALLPRLLRDDYNLIVQDRVIRGSSLAQALLTDARKLHAIGGLAVVAGHTQILRPGPRLEAIRSVVADARAQGDWWLARGDEVADWWLTRASTRVAFAPRDPSAYVAPGFEPAAIGDVLVEAPEEGVAGLWIDVALPDGSGDVIPLVDGRSVEFVETSWGVRVPIPALAGRATARVSFVVAVEGAPAPR